MSLYRRIINLLSTHLQKSGRKIEQLNQQLAQDSTDRLRIALSAAQMGMWDWNRVTGEIRWSPEHEQLFGLAPGQFDGRYETFDACLHPDDREGLNQAIARSLQEKTPYRHEFRVVWADGSVHWIEGRGQAFYTDTGNENGNAVKDPVRMTGTVMAIGDRKQAQLLLQQQVEQQHLVMEMAQRIRQSLNLSDILQTTVDEVRQFLQVDRVIIFRFSPDWGGTVRVESVGNPALAILPFNIYDPCIGNSYVERFKQGLVTAKADIYTAEISPCHVEFLAKFQVRANLVVPILKNGELWGLLVAHHCVAPRQWQDAEVDLLRQIASQVSIALQQAALFEQVQSELNERNQAELALQELNADLEQRIAERTAELSASTDRLLVALTEQQQGRQEIEDLYNNAPCGYHSLDATGIVIRMNDTELNWLGYTRDEVLHKKSFVELLTPGSKQVFDATFPTFKQQGWINNLEFQMVAKDGATRWFNLNSTAIKDAAGNFLMSRSSLFNIDNRKQAELTLQQQTREKQLLWNITQKIRQSLDLNETLNTAVQEVRQTLQVDRVAVYRFQPDWSGDFIAESASEGWVKLVNPEVQKIWEDTHLQDTQGGRFQNQETFVISDIYTAGLHPCHIDLLEQFQAKAYAVAPIFSGETLWGLIAIYQNATARTWQAWEIELLQQITSQLSIALQQSELYSQLQIELQDRQQAAAVLREAERRWRFLLNNVQLIVVGRDQSGKVNFVNPFFLSLTGYAEAEVLGKNWFENFLPPSHQESVQALFSEVLTQNTYPYYQDAILTKSGEARSIAWNNTMLQDSNGKTIGTISIGEDITERQKVEEMKNEFIGIVSHELRTPLTAIQMSLGLLKTGIYANKPEKAQRMIEIALIDTNRLVNLVNDILDLERLESGRAVLEKTVCRAADLMQQAVNGVQAIAAQQNLTLKIAPTDAIVWAAADTILQTLTNLLSNAIKFSPANAVIQLCAERQADTVLFQISDQGRGIPADKLETIFGRFQQVDASDAREKGGTGLGLPICRSIIERHGGKIWAESPPGAGSTFFFTLPIPSEGNV
jgi:PAS domain S-box-containing protein